MKQWYKNVCFTLIIFLFLFPFSVIQAQNNDSPELGPFYPGSTPGMKTVVPEQPVDINKVFEDAGIQGGGIILPDGSIYSSEQKTLIKQPTKSGQETTTNSNGEVIVGGAEKENATSLPDPAVIREQVNTDLKAKETAAPSTTQKPAPTQNQVTNTQGGRYEYKPLVPGFPQPEASGTKDFAGYINSVIKTIIGLTGILAVLMIVIGGIQYVSTDSWSGKDQGKKRIQAALGGLLLALSSFLILNTIDPSLTYLNFATRLEPVKVDQVVGGFAGSQGQVGGIGAEGEAGVDYDLDESVHLDPTGATGGIISGDLETNSDLDSCSGLSEYRAAGNFSATDKDGVQGFVVGEIAWLMKVVPQKWPGLQVSSSYRSLKRNLTSAYGTSDEKADQIIKELNATDKSYSARIAIANKYGLKKAALTSNHVIGEAVDFSGSKAESDALAAWARTNQCLKIGEVIWQAPGHYNHVHLGV